jgi:predicted transcriptional regulator
MKNCCDCCVINDTACPMKNCKYWIKYKDDLNCSLIAIEKHGSMTLREVSERLGISFVRVKQIQDKALKKLSNLGVKFE